LTANEYDVLAGHGWQLVNLGPRILRAETAALAALAAVQSWLEAPSP
jgi:RsmE family RNA methyltransferase